ncbi:unnamed protein product [Ceratitis capitata]|uniref:(Mediterranean fruit fly) hypothetical protein n=1 Tax=Ceratitis capitata TaxID=7213 RepID=A0A811VIZ5_CERCA|nr:unnamed protein product [Ceratitis capitata]
MRTVLAVAEWLYGVTRWQITLTLDIVGGSVEACRNGQRVHFSIWRSLGVTIHT